jgi:hypothetical protein
MVMGYFDDSGTINGDLVCMAGYLADDSSWEGFCKQWDRLLRKYGIPFLHLADFRAAEGPYRELGWEKGQPEIKAALADFITAIQRFTICGIGVTVDVPTFREITKDVKKKEKPLVFCFHRLLKMAATRLDGWYGEEPVCLIFDDSKDYGMKCYSSLWEIKTRYPELKKSIAGIAFGSDECFAPLQAADLLSYATVLAHRVGDGVWSDESSDFRGLLMTSDPAIGKLYDGERWNKLALEHEKDLITAIGNRPHLSIGTRKRQNTSLEKVGNVKSFV